MTWNGSVCSTFISFPFCRTIVYYFVTISLGIEYSCGLSIVDLVLAVLLIWRRSSQATLEVIFFFFFFFGRTTSAFLWRVVGISAFFLWCEGDLWCVSLHIPECTRGKWESWWKKLNDFAHHAYGPIRIMRCCSQENDQWRCRYITKKKIAI